MGVKGLLPCLKSICTSIHIRKYENKKVAVDAYVWLHRGAYSCSSELCQQIETDKYLNYCLNMIKMLKYFKIIPVLVFDGAHLPSKKNTEKGRRSNRKANLERAFSLLKSGQRSAADEFFKKAVDITPKMAYKLIQLCKKERIEFVVAPYEADAQLAYLARTGYVSAVITEDSDLIPYGAPTIILKLDKYGNGEEIHLNNLGMNEQLNFTTFTHDMIIRMCILSGCDYLENLPRIGVKTAYKLVKEHKETDKIIKALRDSNIEMPEDYYENFIKAEMTFRHQRVFDVIEQKLVSLNPLPDDVDESLVEFLGPVHPPDLIRKICNGIVDPNSHEPFENPVMEEKSKVNGFIKSSKHFQNSIQRYFIPQTKTTRKPFIPPRSSQEKKKENVVENNSKSVKKEKKIIVKSKYFQKTNSQKSNSQTSNPSEESSQNSTKSILSIHESSQQSVISISSDEHSDHSNDKASTVGEYPMYNSQSKHIYTSPLINNSIEKVGISTTKKPNLVKFTSMFEKYKFKTKSQSSNDNSQESSQEFETIFKSKSSFSYEISPTKTNKKRKLEQVEVIEISDDEEEVPKKNVFEIYFSKKHSKKKQKL